MPSFVSRVVCALLAAVAASLALGTSAQAQMQDCWDGAETVARDTSQRVWLPCSGSEFTFEILTQPEHGTLEPINATEVEYTPEAGFTGTDSFVFQVAFDGVEVEPRTVELYVVEPEIPVCGDYEIPVERFRSGRSRVLGLGYGCSSLVFPVTYQITKPPRHGTLTESLGGYAYTPDAGYRGDDSFSYKATNSVGQSTDEATQPLEIDPDYNTAPRCYDASKILLRVESTYRMSTTCSDAEGDPIVIDVDRTGMRGTLEVIEPSGGTPRLFAYTAPAEPGDDSYTVTATDDRAAKSDAATISFDVRPSTFNQAPHCFTYGDEYRPTVEAGATTTFAPACSDPDGDRLIPKVLSQPERGQLTVHTYTYGSTTYSSLEYKSTDPGFRGDDTFTYEVTDVPPTGATPMTSEVVTASVKVTAPQPPTCTDPARVGLRTGAERGISLPCWSPVQPITTFTITMPPAHGKLTFPSGQTSGYVYYKPDAGFNGEDSFTYTATSAAGTSREVTQHLTVSATHNTAPRCYSSPAYGSIRAGVTKQLWFACSDDDGDKLTYTMVKGPAHGKLGSVHQPTGSFDSGWVEYTPAANFVGTDTVTYKASDGRASSDVVTMTLEVSKADAN